MGSWSREAVLEHTTTVADILSSALWTAVDLVWIRSLKTASYSLELAAITCILSATLSASLSKTRSWSVFFGYACSLLWCLADLTYMAVQYKERFALHRLPDPHHFPDILFALSAAAYLASLSLSEDVREAAGRLLGCGASAEPSPWLRARFESTATDGGDPALGPSPVLRVAEPESSSLPRTAATSSTPASSTSSLLFPATAPGFGAGLAASVSAPPAPASSSSSSSSLLSSSAGQKNQGEAGPDPRSAGAGEGCAPHRSASVSGPAAPAVGAQGGRSGDAAGKARAASLSSAPRTYPPPNPYPDPRGHLQRSSSTLSSASAREGSGKWRYLRSDLQSVIDVASTLTWMAYDWAWWRRMPFASLWCCTTSSALLFAGALLASDLVSTLAYLSGFFWVGANLKWILQDFRITHPESLLWLCDALITFSYVSFVAAVLTPFLCPGGAEVSLSGIFGRARNPEVSLKRFKRQRRNRAGRRKRHVVIFNSILTKTLLVND